MTRLVGQFFDCPGCHHHFQAEIVESVTHQGQDSDFFPHYVGEDPLPHFLVQCPQCQYCAYPEDYAGEDKLVHPRTARQISDLLEEDEIRKLPPGARRYFLAGRIYEIQKRNSYHTGNLFLRGSWCCRNVGDRPGEIGLQQYAVKHFRQAVEHSSILSPENLPVVTYLVGELYRRLEDKSRAREWFGSVEEAILDSEQQWLVELAKKQAELNEHFIN